METLTTRPAPDGGTRFARGRRRHGWWQAAAVVGVLLASGCAAEEQSPVEQAQAEVTAREEALADAEADATAAAEDFCGAASTYLTALDGYGDVLRETAPTVGDVRTAGEDLAAPQGETLDAAEDVTEAREALAAAQADLAAAQAELAAAEASAAGQEPPASPATPSPTATPVVPAATVARVEQAEADLADARSGITDETPLVQAAEQFNAAAVALEMAWLQLVAQAGCLPEDEQAELVAAARDYTVALQQALATTGYYDGEVDGVYGPATVAAVEALQAANDLPQTGTVDRATEEALRSEVAAAGGAAAEQEVAATAALQQTLALAGYWDGPVDGQSSVALTEAVMALQTDLGVPVTGAVDAVTVAAFQAAVADAVADPSPSPSATEPEATPTP